MTTLQKIIAGRRDCRSEYVEKHPSIVCNDGFTVSVQASNFHYCTPRDNVGPYIHVELGYPSAMPIPEIMEYCESPDKPLETVYGYVPVELVQKLIDEHGGEKCHTVNVVIGSLELEIETPQIQEIKMILTVLVTRNQAQEIGKRATATGRGRASTIYQVPEQVTLNFVQQNIQFPVVAGGTADQPENDENNEYALA